MPLGLLHLTPSGGFRPTQLATAAEGDAVIIRHSCGELQVAHVSSSRPFGRIEEQGPTTSPARGHQQERLQHSPEAARRVGWGWRNA